MPIDWDALDNELAAVGAPEGARPPGPIKQPETDQAGMQYQGGAPSQALSDFFRFAETGALRSNTVGLPFTMAKILRARQIGGEKGQKMLEEVQATLSEEPESWAGRAGLFVGSFADPTLTAGLPGLAAKGAGRVALKGALSEGLQALARKEGLRAAGAKMLLGKGGVEAARMASEGASTSAIRAAIPEIVHQVPVVRGAAEAARLGAWQTQVNLMQQPTVAMAQDPNVSLPEAISQVDVPKAVGQGLQRAPIGAVGGLVGGGLVKQATVAAPLQAGVAAGMDPNLTFKQALPEMVGMNAAAWGMGKATGALGAPLKRGAASIREKLVSPAAPLPKAGGAVREVYAREPEPVTKKSNERQDIVQMPSGLRGYTKGVEFVYGDRPDRRKYKITAKPVLSPTTGRWVTEAQDLRSGARVNIDLERLDRFQKGMPEEGPAATEPGGVGPSPPPPSAGGQPVSRPQATPPRSFQDEQRIRWEDEQDYLRSQGRQGPNQAIGEAPAGGQGGGRVQTRSETPSPKYGELSEEPEFKTPEGTVIREHEGVRPKVIPRPLPTERAAVKTPESEAAHQKFLQEKEARQGQLGAYREPMAGEAPPRFAPKPDINWRNPEAPFHERVIALHAEQRRRLIHLRRTRKTLKTRYSWDIDEQGNRVQLADTAIDPAHRRTLGRIDAEIARTEASMGETSGFLKAGGYKARTIYPEKRRPVQEIGKEGEAAAEVAGGGVSKEERRSQFDRDWNETVIKPGEDEAFRSVPRETEGARGKKRTEDEETPRTGPSRQELEYRYERIRDLINNTLKEENAPPVPKSWVKYAKMLENVLVGEHGMARHKEKEAAPLQRALLSGRIAGSKPETPFEGVPLKMSFRYGTEAISKAFADSKTTFEAIRRGIRTSTTRHFSSNENIPVATRNRGPVKMSELRTGDDIEVDSGSGDRLRVRLTHDAWIGKFDQLPIKKWSEAEGWSPGYGSKNFAGRDVIVLRYKYMETTKKSAYDKEAAKKFYAEHPNWKNYTLEKIAELYKNNDNWLPRNVLRAFPVEARREFRSGETDRETMDTIGQDPEFVQDYVGRPEKRGYFEGMPKQGEVIIEKVWEKLAKMYVTSPSKFKELMNNRDVPPWVHALARDAHRLARRRGFPEPSDKATLWERMVEELTKYERAHLPGEQRPKAEDLSAEELIQTKSETGRGGYKHYEIEKYLHETKRISKELLSEIHDTFGIKKTLFGMKSARMRKPTKEELGSETTFDFVRREFEAGRPVNLNGKKVESPEDMGLVGQLLRHPTVERSVLVGIKNGVIERVEIYTLNMPDVTTYAPLTEHQNKLVDILIEQGEFHKAHKLQNEYEQKNATEAIKRFSEYDAVYHLHNHPATNYAFSSQQDIRVMDNLFNLMPNFKGGIILDHTHFSYSYRGSEGDIRHTVYRLPKEIWGAKDPFYTEIPLAVNPEKQLSDQPGSEVFNVIANSVASDPKDLVSLMYVGNAGEITGVQTIPISSLTHPNALKWLRDQVARFNSAYAPVAIGPNSEKISPESRKALQLLYDRNLLSKYIFKNGEDHVSLGLEISPSDAAEMFKLGQFTGISGQGPSRMSFTPKSTHTDFSDEIISTLSRTVDIPRDPEAYERRNYLFRAAKNLLIPKKYRDSVEFEEPTRDLGVGEYFNSPSFLARLDKTGNATKMVKLGSAARDLLISWTTDVGRRIEQMYEGLSEQHEILIGRFLGENADPKQVEADYGKRVAEAYVSNRMLLTEMGMELVARGHLPPDIPSDWWNSYFPHIQRGSFMVKVIKPGGGEKLVDLHDAPSFVESMEEAMKSAAIAADHYGPGYKIRISRRATIDRELQSLLTQEEFSQFLNRATASADPAALGEAIATEEFSQLWKNVRDRKAFMRRMAPQLLQRKVNLRGWIKSARKATQIYALTSIKKMVYDPYLKDSAELVRKMDHEKQPRMTNYFEEYRKIIAGKQSNVSAAFDEIGKIIGAKPLLLDRIVARIMYGKGWIPGTTQLVLGYNPMSAMVNLSQTLINTVPVTSVDDVLWAFSVRNGAEGRRLIEEAKIGYFDPKYMSPDLPKTRFPKELAHWKERMLPMYFFQKAETINHEVAFLAGYKWAQNKGMNHSQSMEHGLEIRNNTQFRYDVADLPRMFHNPLARLLFQFKPYLIKELEFLYDLARSDNTSGKAFAGIGMAFLAGLTGLPFLKDTEWFRKFRAANPEIGYGGIAALTGYEASESLGFGGNIIPMPNDMVRTGFGPTVSKFADVGKGLFTAIKTYPLTTLKDPKWWATTSDPAVRRARRAMNFSSWARLVDGHRAYTKGYTEVMSARGKMRAPVSKTEAAVMALGPRPVRLSQYQDVEYSMKQIVEDKRAQKADYIASARDAMVRKDYKEVQGIVKQARDKGIYITGKDLSKAMREGAMTSTLRTFKHAPKAVRGELAPWLKRSQELEGQVRPQ